MSDDFVIVREHPDLINYIDALQRKHALELSFYPRSVFEREADKGRLFLGLLNGQAAGYIWVGAAGLDMRCHQVCIQYDARRRLYGAALAVAIEDHALAGNSASITLRCGFDLDANDFWASLGYGVIAHHQGGVRRMRTINVWRKQLTPTLFEPIHLEPARGVRSAAVWTKNKRTGLVSQFARGRRLKDYRATVLGVREDE